MKRRIFFFCLMVIGIAFTLYPGSDIKLEKLRQQLQEQLNLLVKETTFPGATLAVALPNEESINIAAGVSDLESRAEMKPNSRIFSGSIGKTFVAAIVLQLVEEKKLTLEEKAEIYFKHCQWFSRVPNGSKLTIRMLLNHTGGLPEHILSDEFRAIIIKTPDRVYKPEELIAYILDKKPVHEAGNGWSYSDTDYIFLGMIIEKITGHTYYDELKQRILVPFGLQHTAPANRRDLTGLAAGYTGKEPFDFPRKVSENGKYVVNPQFEWTGGGLVTTSLDLARWAKMLYEGKVISSASLEKMLQTVDTHTEKPNSFGYGLGVQVWESEAGLIYGHGGIFPGYQSQMEYLPRYKFSLALQVNTDRTVSEQAKYMHKHVSVFIPMVIKYLNR